MSIPNTRCSLCSPPNPHVASYLLPAGRSISTSRLPGRQSGSRSTTVPAGDTSPAMPGKSSSTVVPAWVAIATHRFNRSACRIALSSPQPSHQSNPSRHATSSVFGHRGQEPNRTTRHRLQRSQWRPTSSRHPLPHKSRSRRCARPRRTPAASTQPSNRSRPHRGGVSAKLPRPHRGPGPKLHSL